MRFDFTAVCLVLSAALVSGPSGQDADDSLGRDAFKRIQEEASSEVRENIVGAWRLTDFDHPIENVDRSNVAGFAIFSEGYMAIVLHARRFADDPSIYADLAQATAGKWQLPSHDRLQIATIVGHSNFSGDLVYETGATPREYEPRVIDANTLLLRRPDGALLTFARMRPSAFSPELQKILDDSRGQQAGEL